MKTFLLITGVFGVISTSLAGEIFNAVFKNEKLEFPDKKIWKKNFSIEKEGEISFIRIPAQTGSCFTTRMSEPEAELMKKGNFSIQTKVRVNGKNGHIYLCGIGAGAGDEGARLGLELRDGKIIPYFNLNFTLGPRKFKPFSIASRDNTLKSGEWFRITVVVNRTASMTLYINGVAAASADISAFADNEMTDFVRKGLAISTSKNGSFMQYRPLILDAEYDAAADIAEMKVKTGALGSLQIKNQK